MSKSNNCRVCNNPIQAFMSFGPMPLGNGFKNPELKKKEYTFEMQTAVCSSCSTFQLIDQPNQGVLIPNTTLNLFVDVTNVGFCF